MKLNCKKKCVEENGTWDILKGNNSKRYYFGSVFSLSYRDVSEILKERGVSVHPTTIMRYTNKKEKSHSRLLFFNVQGITEVIQNRLNDNYIFCKRVGVFQTLQQNPFSYTIQLL
jgi:hypothetical protein